MLVKRQGIEPVEAKNMFIYVQQKFTLISEIYKMIQIVEIVFHPQE